MGSERGAAVRRAGLVFSAALASALAAAGCLTEVDLDASEVCDNVGWAISSRTLDCTSDAALANARFDAFSTHVTCAPAGGPRGSDFECAYAVGTASCAEVAQLGDDFSAWLTRSSTCARLFPGGVR